MIVGSHGLQILKSTNLRHRSLHMVNGQPVSWHGKIDKVGACRGDSTSEKAHRLAASHNLHMYSSQRGNPCPWTRRELSLRFLPMAWWLHHMHHIWEHKLYKDIAKLVIVTKGIQPTGGNLERNKSYFAYQLWMERHRDIHYKCSIWSIRDDTICPWLVKSIENNFGEVIHNL